jgi:hypothetical protein
MEFEIHPSLVILNCKQFFPFSENELGAQDEVDAVTDRGEQRGGGHRDAVPRQQVVQLPFNAA